MEDTSEFTEDLSPELEMEETKKASPSKESINKRFLRLPMARIKNMMKRDPDCTLINQDSVFLITKATEMFIEYMSREAHHQIHSTKRKTVLRRDVDKVIDSTPNLCFLDGALE